jgi:hypothetical protein
MVPHAIAALVAANQVSVQVAAAPSFDPAFEYSPDPGFDNAGAGTLGGTGGSITGSQWVVVSGNNATVTYVAAGTLAPGTYRVSVDTASTTNVSSVTATIGGVSAPCTATVGVHTTDIVVAAIADQNLILKVVFSGKTITFNGISVKRVA